MKEKIGTHTNFWASCHWLIPLPNYLLCFHCVLTTFFIPIPCINFQNNLHPVPLYYYFNWSVYYVVAWSAATVSCTWTLHHMSLPDLYPTWSGSQCLIWSALTIIIHYASFMSLLICNLISYPICSPCVLTQSVSLVMV